MLKNRELDLKINSFLARKSKQFPGLRFREKDISR